MRRYIIVFYLFLFVSQLWAQNVKSNPEGYKIAEKHAIKIDKPAPDFFEGALLGNGGMGVVVTTRPDAVVLYFGHNNVWDIRLAENNRDSLRNFQYVFDKVNKISPELKHLTDDPWYARYNQMAAENYSQPYPRPFPCGAIVFSLDLRKAKITGHQLDISNGLCNVKIRTADGRTNILELFTDMKSDKLLFRLTDALGKSVPNVFEKVKILPDPSTPTAFPKYNAFEELDKGRISFKQVLPTLKKSGAKLNDQKDKAFSLTLDISSVLSKKSRIGWDGNPQEMTTMEAAIKQGEPLMGTISLLEGLNFKVPEKDEALVKLNNTHWNSSRKANELIWKSYWDQSQVELNDSFLESIWYRNLYFLNCAAKDGVTCPGLFANWSYNNIGTAWHGDYHMNYNTQQPFWVTFSSNHLEKNLPYISLIESLMPVSRKWAQEYYGLPGAYFPHSAFPVEMMMNPYPIPDWGWEVSETPWAVQGLWWHYQYSGDQEFLRNRAYAPIKAAVEFLCAYMKRPDAHGSKRWKDDKYHIFPTVPPEQYGLRPGFELNYDCAVDLTLTKFIFKAFKNACRILSTTENEIKLLEDVDDILAHFPDYPTTESKDYGKIFVSVPGERENIVYNVPNPLIAVFPGEDFGLHTKGETRKILENTYKAQQNEGGNDLVFINLQAARLGLLDLNAFKEQVKYSLLPNGTATDMVMQTGGRYQELSDYAYMSKMGIWFENFALPAVINECLMQSYSGTIKFFPNWPKRTDARFAKLRASGAFLVSAKVKNGKFGAISVLSEKGNKLTVEIPWGKGGTYHDRKGIHPIASSIITVNTKAGEEILFIPG